MLAEKIVVGTTGTLLAGGAILGLLAFATQTPALGITLAVLILLSPVLLLALVVWLKITRRSKKTADLGTIESGGEISRSLLFAALLFVVGIVVLACGLSGSVIVIAGFVLATGCGVVVLLAIFGPFLPRTLVRLRSVAGSRKALNAAVGEFLDGQVEQAADKFRDYGDRVPGDEAGFHWQSIALVQKGQFEAALELADKGISLRPTAFGFLQRGEVLLALGCEELALADANEGLRFDPNALALTFIKGAALINLRRLNEAVEVF